jgi:hypothetical protein
MSKPTKKSGKPTGKVIVKKTVAGRQTVEATTKTIAVAKKDEKYEGARAQWYAALLAHDGQTNDVFIDACSKKPPAVPKSGKAEDPRGWLRYFVREGVASLS